MYMILSYAIGKNGRGNSGVPANVPTNRLQEVWTMNYSRLTSVVDSFLNWSDGAEQKDCIQWDAKYPSDYRILAGIRIIKTVCIYKTSGHRCYVALFCSNYGGTHARILLLVCQTDSARPVDYDESLLSFVSLLRKELTRLHYFTEAVLSSNKIAEKLRCYIFWSPEIPVYLTNYTMPSSFSRATAIRHHYTR